MGIKAILAKPFAGYLTRKIKNWSSHPIETQDKVFHYLINHAKNTLFGKEHHFEKIKHYEEFKKEVPIRDYDGFSAYIERIRAGEEDVLWSGRPLYLSKTSGTVTGIKYIPLTQESIPYHINGARNALLYYIAHTGKSEFVNGKMIFLSGSPELDKSGKIPVGRLSGIVNHYVPAYLRRNQMPSYETNCIDDWETKVDAIVEETIKENMTLISGIPSWVQLYFDKLMEKTGKKIIDIFPDFSLFVFGGVNYEPYRAKFENCIGKTIDSLELYPASEGFIAFQDEYEKRDSQNGLLLLLDSGMFYEFIPANEIFNEHPTRISLLEVELGVNYAIILNTNAGLWGYNIGDTVRFVSKNPYRLIVTGRIKHFTSAFGEHVIAEEVEKAIMTACRESDVEVMEFTVAPQVNPTDGTLPYHEWFIEFSKPVSDINLFGMKIDHAMQDQNIYYHDLIKGKILQPLKIRRMHKDAFVNYMKSIGKLGGQNKIPRLSNDRKIADELQKFVIN